jgi:hypothetical protein
MAEKSGELRENSGILTETDKDIISTVADRDNEEFVDKYTDGVVSRDASTRDGDDDYDEEADETVETEQIREQIEETRRGMGETIDAIQEKLSFQNISDQVKDTVSEQLTNAIETAKTTVYDATIGKAGKLMKNVGRELSKSDVGRIAADNPFPLLLIGLGVGLLAYQGFGGKRRSSYGYRSEYDRNYRGTGEGSSRSLLSTAQNKIGSTASGAYDSVSGAASSAAGTVTGAANTAYEGVSSAANSAYEGVSSAANTAYSGVTDYSKRAYEKVGDLGTQAREQYDYYLEENPLAIGAVALAVGAAVGLSLPSTRYEGQLMGEYRQNLLDKAQNAAGDLVERVKEVANEAKETIKDEAQAQGLTGDKTTGTTGGTIGGTSGTSTTPKTGFGSNKI